MVRARLVALNKGIQDSPGFWIPRHGFRIPKPRIPNSSIKISKIPNSTGKTISGIPDLDSLAWRERGRLLESIAKSSALQDG